MYIGLGELLAWLPLTRAEMRRRLRRYIAGQVLLMCFGVLVMGAFFFAAFSQLGLTGLVGSGFNSAFSITELLEITCMVLTLPLQSSRIHDISEKSGRIWAGGGALRRAIRAGDETIAPLAQQQPARLAGTDLPVGPEPLGPLRVPRGMVLSSTFWGIVGVFLALFIAGPLFGLAIYFAPPSPAPDGLELVSGGLLALLVVGTALAFRRGAQLRRSVRVTVESDGLWWWSARERRRVHVAWAEVRGFGALSARSPSTGRVSTVYLMDAERMVLLWEDGPRANDAERAAAERMARLVVTMTGVPLRDASSAAHLIEATGGELKSGERLWRLVRGLPDYAVEMARRVEGMESLRKTFEQIQEKAEETRKIALGIDQTGRDAITHALLPFYDAADLREVAGITATGEASRVGRPIRRVGWIALLVMLLAALLARAQGQTVLFADPLTSDDGAWPVATISGGVTVDERFTADGYQITNARAEGTLSVLAPGTYGDVAVAVTMRQSGDTPVKYALGGGLALRASDDASQEVTFTVAPDGSWVMYDEQTTSTKLLALGHSRAIHRGVKSANRLLVIARGSEFPCFVNGQWVTTWRDTDARATGHVGLYVSFADATGVFSDLRVSMPPDVPPLWPWDGLGTMLSAA